MREYLAQLIAESGTLTAQEIVLHITASVVLSAAIYVSYWFTHAGTAYSKKFNVSLVSLTILTATVMTVIGNNIANVNHYGFKAEKASFSPSRYTEMITPSSRFFKNTNTPTTPPVTAWTATWSWGTRLTLIQARASV